MRVKTYRAATLKEALQKVKRDLGTDAFIQGQREVKPANLLGLIQKARVEVTAAADHLNDSPEKAVARDTKKRQEARHASADAIDAVDDRVPLSGSIPQADSKADDSPVNQAVPDEIRKLNTAIRLISSDRKAPIMWLKPRRFSTPASKNLYGTLVARGISENLAAELVSPSNASAGTVASALVERIRIYPDLVPGAAPDKPEVVAFLGPTGVGKTTTIAKIAAHAAFQKNLKVGLVTLDNFRIAAVEHLKTYGDIMGIPVDVVAGVKQLPDAVDSLSDKDLILIDTTGRSHHTIRHEWELASFLNSSDEIKKALLVSATTNASDLAEAVDQYGIFNPGCLIFTKLDETSVRGAVVNELIRSGKPLAYFTMGQGVPHDIFKPSERQLVDLTIGHKSDESWTKFLHAVRQPQAPHQPHESTKATRRQVR